MNVLLILQRHAISAARSWGDAAGASRLEERRQELMDYGEGSDEGRSAQREWLALARRRDTCSYEQVSLAVTWVSLEVEQW